MPKMTDRERLAKIETDQRNLAQEAEAVRRGLRAHYGKLATELPVEKLSEREFRDVLSQAIRVGGGVAIAALKGLAASGVQAEPSPGPSRKRAAAAPSGGDDGAKVVHP
ncbi:hypothetical protein [Sphingomonas sanxanigenens]|uniref:Uncharacterized protein n=1 Tax=Sphingomonas sanxanigenens DSM 19645 = NX02 TaxID=1123269 RepID=W0ABP0_9SPHN|nr:hypothetical protein [Sphingomonas sanxanigenens]AHE53738.1 hypothetical protein NX02_10090 [Sphingomonas sanxanigenens DSM 19645 = NX02]